jgi:hypothetical protein
VKKFKIPYGRPLWTYLVYLLALKSFTMPTMALWRYIEINAFFAGIFCKSLFFLDITMKAMKRVEVRARKG